jgi:hypothetical protein
MARVNRAKAARPNDENLMLPFELEEAVAIERPAAAVAAPAPPPILRSAVPPMPSTPFGRWLVAQTKDEGWIGDLAKAAKGDRAFPLGGDADAVRARLSVAGAESDMIEAVDAAERAWLTGFK